MSIKFVAEFNSISSEDLEIILEDTGYEYEGVSHPSIVNSNDKFTVTGEWSEIESVMDSLSELVNDYYPNSVIKVKE